jgi:hypothetical protein
MYSAFKTSWVSGLVVVGAGLVYMLFIIASLSDSATDGAVVQAGWLTMAAVAIYAAVVAAAVRVGLHIAGSSHLSRQSALAIPVIYLVAVGLLSTVPVRTHAAIDSAGTSSMIAVTVSILLLLLVVLPLAISFVIGRMSRKAFGSA